MKVVNLQQYQQMKNSDIKKGRYDASLLLLSIATAVKETIMHDRPQKLTIVCGNNQKGAIGLMLAHLLSKEKQIDVQVCSIYDNFSPLIKMLQTDGVEMIMDLREIRDLLPEAQYVVDCIWDIEEVEPVYYPYTYLIGWVNSSKGYKLSVDAPSGMNVDKGDDFGCVIKADKTVTMSAPKLGFYLYPGNINIGELVIAPTAISLDAIEEIDTCFSINSLHQVKEKLPPRRKHSYKGSYGKVLLIAGCKQTAGACILCGKAILKSGAGLLTIMSHKEVLPTINLTFPEAMTIEIDDYNVYYQLSKMDFNDYDLIVIGPGLGRFSDTEELLIKSLKSNRPVVVDADGLYYLKKHLDLVAERKQLTVITPHVGEYKRIFEYDEKRIVENLIDINKAYPNLAVVLKGENTLIAYKEHITINTTGNNALAKGGSGDVLAGVVGGLLAQKADIDSVVAGVYVHSLAADYWVKEHSEYTLLASDLIEMIDKAFVELIKTTED